MSKLFRLVSLRSLAVLALMAVLLPGFVGCGGDTVQEETIQVPQVSALEEAKQILQNYANGALVTSEAAGFPDLIARVKAEDAAKGAELEKGLNQIKAQPNNRASIAKNLLTRL